MSSTPIKTWHGALRLEKGIQKPQGLNISLSDLALAAVCRYIDTPQAVVENFKKATGIERRADNTYTAAVRFDLSADLHAKLTARRFAATFVAYAVTELVKSFDGLTPEERRKAFEVLETSAYRYKKHAVERLTEEPEPPYPQQPTTYAPPLPQQYPPQPSQAPPLPPQYGIAQQRTSYVPQFQPQLAQTQATQSQYNPHTVLRKR